MSMILGLATVSDATIARLLADPPLVWKVIAPDDPEAYERDRARPRGPSFLARLFGARATPPPAEPPAELVLEEAEGGTGDLDKAWHGIHYLLTGTAWGGDPPLNFLVTGGREVGRIDVGYGPARVLSAAETRSAHEALSRLSDDELRARFKPGDMQEKKIYPDEIWARDPEEDDSLGYVMEYLGTLRQFLAMAVERKMGLLVWVS